MNRVNFVFCNVKSLMCVTQIFIYFFILFSTQQDNEAKNSFRGRVSQNTYIYIYPIITSGKFRSLSFCYIYTRRLSPLFPPRLVCNTHKRDVMRPRESFFERRKKKRSFEREFFLFSYYTPLPHFWLSHYVNKITTPKIFFARLTTMKKNLQDR